jgi:hypothetical protein
MRIGEKVSGFSFGIEPKTTPELEIIFHQAVEKGPPASLRFDRLAPTYQ